MILEKLNFTTNIKAPAKKVWEVLWFDATYRRWTGVFSEGSHAESEWNEGSKIRFLNPEGDGMFSVIEKLIPNSQMSFKHLGEVQKGKEKSTQWEGAREQYFLTEADGITTLRVELDTTSEFADYFTKTFPKALELIKEISENPVEITIEATIQAGIEKVWRYWTEPQHIIQWNNASDEWHCPQAENDLCSGGKFMFTMAAKDGSFSFDFDGTYTEVEHHKKIKYNISDGRKVSIQFMSDGATCIVKETFEAESENSLELQLTGWQAILNNFKKHVETYEEH
ncbi:MAG: SRPBCC domain-containing protein [Chitinophagales bacterium]